MNIKKRVENILYSEYGKIENPSQIKYDGLFCSQECNYHCGIFKEKYEFCGLFRKSRLSNNYKERLMYLKWSDKSGKFYRCSQCTNVMKADLIRLKKELYKKKKWSTWRIK